DGMLRLHGLGSNTPSGVPYTDNDIMVIFHGGKQRGHIIGIGKVLSGQETLESQPEYSGGNGSGGCEDDEPEDDKDGDKDEEDADS
nr:hypothetical protein [Tanacetum cinerariifolium]